MPRTTKFILDFANYLSTFTVLLGVATCIFKFLPQANISWRNALDGALVSSALFVIGKFIVSFYISFNPIFSAYTATSSLILLLAWVYYSSIVLYIGALVTKLLNKKFEKSTTNAVSKSVATSTVSTPTASKYKNRIVNK
jgi:membrane protein